MKKKSITINGQKRCSKCLGWFPATDQFFHRDKRSGDGLFCQCAFCRRKTARKYAAEHREEARARAKKWAEENSERYSKNQKRYREEHKDELRYYNLQWRHNNPERARGHSRRWRKQNPEKAKAVVRAYSKRNPSINRAKHVRRRGRIFKAKGKVSADDIRIIYDQQNGLCHWCQAPVGDDYHIDHRIPLVRGGSNKPGNLVISCPHCNQSKGGRMPWEWSGRLL